MRNQGEHRSAGNAFNFLLGVNCVIQSLTEQYGEDTKECTEDTADQEVERRSRRDRPSWQRRWVDYSNSIIVDCLSDLCFPEPRLKHCVNLCKAGRCAIKAGVF